MCEAHFSVPAWHMDAQFETYFPGHTAVMEILSKRIKNERVPYNATHPYYMKMNEKLTQKLKPTMYAAGQFQ
jgi:beta-galactosidase GanA